MNRHNCALFALFVLSFFALPFTALSADVANGEKLYQINCGACHLMGKNATGPNLEGVEGRWESKELLYQWIKNPSQVKAMGNPYVDQLLAEWEPRGGLMAAQAVTDAEIDDILAYITNWAPPAPVVDNSAVQTDGSAAADEPNLDVKTLIFIIIGLLVVLGVMLRIRARVNQLSGKTKEKGPLGVLIGELKDFVTKQMNPTLLVLSAVGILSIFMVIDMYNRAQDLGLQQGYAPDQPIKFSHKLHAGQYGIDCQYCHTGVEKSKNANIPSANICMNCHNVVSSGPTYGKTEIAKIYAAIGYDADKGKYSGEQKPIEWVRIHNLPDHVYFNHKQHVVAGNLDCENCHGNVREMEVVQQVSLLEMGWCIDCHRKTEVEIDNNYYQEHFHQVFKDDYAAYMAKVTKEEDKIDLATFIKEHKKYTVGDMGGLECQKCHY
ncbi:MAG: c-type cytochrome [Bacteroidetes bacterium]|nr:c-type cytochrome [Bacteroidota bacterium]